MGEPQLERDLGAVILAAGAASRFGEPKQRLLLPNVLGRVLTTRASQIVVVAGAHPLDVPDDPRVHLVSAPDWHLGPGASLRAGLGALGGEIEAAINYLADGPNVDPEAAARVVAAWRSGDRPLVAPDYGRGRSHPMLIAREHWGTIPDRGGRALSPFLVDCRDLSAPGDVNTQEDLDRLRNV
ncbi:MAG: NTP transferase domain-containing protein [Gaiellales bacterium]